jgi:hypothetical protein
MASAEAALVIMESAKKALAIEFQKAATLGIKKGFDTFFGKALTIIATAPLLEASQRADLCGLVLQSVKSFWPDFTYRTKPLKNGDITLLGPTAGILIKKDGRIFWGKYKEYNPVQVQKETFWDPNKNKDFTNIFKEIKPLKDFDSFDALVQDFKNPQSVIPWNENPPRFQDLFPGQVPTPKVPSRLPNPLQMF